MESSQPSPTSVVLDLTDVRLGVANVLIALHLTRQIDLDLALPEIERLTELTNYGVEQTRSSFSRLLAADLRGPLAPRWHNDG